MKKILFLFVLTCVVVTACGPVTPVPTPTIPFMTPTLFRTATPSPAPLPVNTPYLTPEVATYDLPQWLRDSDDHVLMLIEPKKNFRQRESYRVVTFFNVDINERFDISFPYFEYAFWLDKQHIGFVHGDSCRSFKFGSILSLSTSRVTRYMFKDLDDKRFCPDSLLVEKAYIDYEDNTAFNIYNIYRDVPTTFHLNQPGAVNLVAQLSPNSLYIAVLQNASGSFESGNRLVIYYFPFFDYFAEIVDTEIGTVLSFSQDGKKLYYFQAQTPCVFDLVTKGKKCGSSLNENYIVRNLSPVQLDETKIILSVEITDNKREVCLQDEITPWSDCEVVGLESAICIYDFTSGETSCPTRWLEYLESSTSVELDADNVYSLVTRYFTIGNILPSPDGQFVLFTSKGHPDSEQKCGIIFMDEIKYYELNGNTCMETWPRYFLTEWRPMR